VVTDDGKRKPTCKERIDGGLPTVGTVSDAELS
jgi:hypothetical protein